MLMSALTKDLPQHQAGSVMTAFEQGMAYAWGRQDADGSTEERDTSRAERFAYAFAMAKRDFVTERYWSMNNLETAYENWRRSRVVEPARLTCGTMPR